MADFGLTPLGWVSKQQTDIISEIRTDLTQLFGQNLNLLPESVLGQLTGYFSERESLVWQMGEAVYHSQYPAGAEGTSVDNVLSLNNLRRLDARKSQTDPTPITQVNGIRLFGLLLRGTAGTTIIAGSIIQTNLAPPANFILDSDVVIAAAVDAIQTVYFSNVPDTGAFTLLIGPDSLETASLPYTADAAAVQAAIVAITGFGDVTVAGSFTTGFVITYTGTIGHQAVPIAQLGTSSLQNGSTVTNIRVDNTIEGAPAQVEGSATCNVTGPTPGPAGSLAVIGSPVSGWTSVTNQLDILPGADREEDTEALDRRATLLAAQANGPLQAIKEKVRQVLGVTQAVAFENRNVSALQKIQFSDVPDFGVFQIALEDGTTAAIPFTATAMDVQDAIQAVSGYEDVIVSGDFLNGFSIDFNSSGGARTQALATITGNTLTESSNPVTTEVTYGRPGKSFEIVVQGGSDADIATAIFKSKPAGIQSYGTTTYEVTDADGNLNPISFSRAQEVPIYVEIALVTDLETANVPEFNPGSVADIKKDITDIGGKIKIGGIIIGFGSNGLIGAFNSVPGIISYTIKFGSSPSPTLNSNIPLLSDQIPIFEGFNVVVSYV